MPSSGDCIECQPAAAVGALRQSRTIHGDSLLILLLGTVAFACLPAPEFVGFNARFALFAQEMLRNGPSFFPTLHGVPYPDYPGASTLLIYLASLPGGHVTPFLAVLPTAIISALILVVTYQIGALWSRRRGLAAVLFALLTIEFFALSRSVALDQYTSLATAFSFYLAYSSDRLTQHKRRWLLPLVWTLGFVFRGPIGLLTPAAVTCFYYLWNARFRMMLLAGIAAGGLFILCLGGLLLAARSQGGTALAKEVIETQMVGRFDDRGPGLAYYWYGALLSYAVTYPIAILVVISRFRRIARKETAEDAFLGVLALWVVVILAAMSIPSAKKTRYIVSIVPALSLMASSLLTDATISGFLVQMKRLFLRICVSLPTVFAVGVAAILAFACLRRPEWRACSLGTLAVLVPLVLAAWKLGRNWTHAENRDMYLLAVGAAAFVIVYIGMVGPITYSSEKTRPFVRAVEAAQEKAPGPICFFRVGPDGEDVKYMAHTTKPVDVRFIDSLAPLRSISGVQYVLMRETVFDSLGPGEYDTMRLLARGEIGHRSYVALVQDGRQ